MEQQLNVNSTVRLQWKVVHIKYICSAGESNYPVTSGTKPFNFSYLDISHKLLTNYAVHTIFHTQPSSPMLVPTPFVPRDSFIKADAQQIQLMYFPATYPPTTYLATYTIIHSVGNTFCSDVLYFSRVLINIKTICVEYRTRLGIVGIK